MGFMNKATIDFIKELIEKIDNLEHDLESEFSTDFNESDKRRKANKRKLIIKLNKLIKDSNQE